MIKKNWKKIIIALIIVVAVASAGVYADTVMDAQNVTYQKSDGNVIMVDEALDDLTTKADAKLALMPRFTKGQLVKLNNDPVSTDQYYVLNEYANTVELFAKFNLNTSATEQVDASYSTTACEFSSSKYWGSATGLNLNLEPGYSATDAVGKARSYAKSKGAIDGRLLTYQEVINLTGSEDWSSSTTIDPAIKTMINGADSAKGYEYYWLGSGYEDNVYRVRLVNGEISEAYHYDFNDGYYYYFGVRPVITVYKSQVEAVVNTITFSVNSRIISGEYTAEKGMTWREWCSSDYNTDRLLC